MPSHQSMDPFGSDTLNRPYASLNSPQAKDGGKKSVDKKATLNEEMKRMNKLPANSAYATHRLRVLDKVLQLLSIQGQFTIFPRSHLISDVAKDHHKELYKIICLSHATDSRYPVHAYSICERERESASTRPLLVSSDDVGDGGNRDTFQAEINQLLSLIINTFYSNKDLSA